MTKEQKQEIMLALSVLWLKVLAYQVERILNERRITADEWDETKHPRRKDGKFGRDVKNNSQSHGGRDIIQAMKTKTGTVGEGKGAVEVNLGFGDGKPDFSAMTTNTGHDSYHERHAVEMGLNFRQWKQSAADLLNDEPREIYRDWENPDDDSFNRFDMRTSRLAVGDKGGTINTYFILEKRKYKYYLPKEYLEEIRKKK